MPGPVHELWVYLAESSLLWLTLTVLAFIAGEGVHRRAGGMALLHPVMLAIGLLVAVLALTGTSYERYFEGAQFVHFLLGPATVALAVPLYRQLPDLRRHWRAILASVLAGAAVASSVAMLTAAQLGASWPTILSLGPKSVTTPIAMGIAEQIGGLPALTAVVVILTGILGAVIGAPVLDLAGIRDPRARGLAMGVAAHGIGTAAAFDEGLRTGAFAGMAMALSAVLTAMLLPLALLAVAPG